MRQLVCVGLLALASISTIGGCDSSHGEQTAVVSSGAEIHKITWHPCEGLLPEVIRVAGLRDPEHDDRFSPHVSLGCGYLSDSPRYGVNISTNDLTLDDRKVDKKFTVLYEAELGGRRALVTRLYETACHVSVEVEPGMIDFQIGYSKIGVGFPTVESACAQAITLATVLSPYFPDHL